MSRRRIALAAAFLAAAPLATPLSASAEPGGCLKYGAAGAAGGHFVGKGHAVLGAMTGCGVGMWRRHHARKQAKAQAQANANATAKTPAPGAPAQSTTQGTTQGSVQPNGAAATQPK